MNRSLVAVLLAVGLMSRACPARAEFPDRDGEGIISAKLMNARIAGELSLRAGALGTSNHPSDTTWVGYNPAYGGSNYWSIGVGHRYNRGTFGPGKGDI